MKTSNAMKNAVTVKTPRLTRLPGPAAPLTTTVVPSRHCQDVSAVFTQTHVLSSLEARS